VTPLDDVKVRPVAEKSKDHVEKRQLPDDFSISESDKRRIRMSCASLSPFFAQSGWMLGL
jgi:hypothetical protein